MQVTSKRQNYDLFGAGAYGNTLQQWPSIEALKASGHKAPVTMRYNGPIGGGGCIYDIPIDEVERIHNVWIAQGCERARIYFNETAPNHKALLQGELVTDPRFGYALHYSRAPLPMRDALRINARNHLGPGALLILKQLMTAASYDDLRAVLDLYPDSAIELSIFSVNVGSAPRRNSIIWEVRNY